MGTTRLDTGNFMLGRPALVCRWRMSGGVLPMENRHLRALAARTVNGERVSQGLVAWAKQHIEWTLAEGSREHPDGVLMLIVDETGQAAMTVGPYEPLADTTLGAILRRVGDAQDEEAVTGVAPESLWLVRGKVLLHSGVAGRQASGACSLVEDLAHTMGIACMRRERLADEVARRLEPFDEAFLVSDEHGVVGIEGWAGDRARRFEGAYQRLLETARHKGRRS